MTTGAKKRLSLQTQMILLIGFLLVLLIALVGLAFSSIISSTIEEQIGKRALLVARTVATMPEVREAFQLPDPSKVIQPIAERIRRNTEAEFIVVGNRDGIRYAHPYPDRLGKQMVGGDNEQALVYGRTYLSKAVGTLGPSLRGKTPVRNDRGEVIGIVSVGFLLKDIDLAIAGYLKQVLVIAFLAVIVGIFGAIFLSRRFKQAIFGLEPAEIAALFVERNAVLESVREGIISINREGQVTMMNKAASAILNLPQVTIQEKLSIEEVFPATKMPEVLKTGEQQLDREIVVAGKEIIVNRIPVKVNEQVIGVVSSFRLKSEMDLLAKELSQVRQYAEALRSQTHEFHNLLYTISGLLQLGATREAIELITQESSTQQELITFLVKALHDPYVSAFFVGMHNRAKELKVRFTIDRDSSLQRLPEHLPHQLMIILLGNLIQNSFDSVLDQDPANREVLCYLSDRGDDILLEVEDSGKGIPEEKVEKIFEYGYSTKEGEHRGIGLTKVKQIVDDARGYILVNRSELGGTLFTISLPKVREVVDE
ncbi:sensor histidine kinase [Brevibacillus humidisoli]|uniref:ATP-binding protein n=1 Tax=Brevibacillus humidisoli TaxID=2895522 RepID=UPI001E5CC5FC|nr:sensor histidine kinase [Brevibacillus humidisoli]UFJ42556.1 sensor histidine kinase [Brevibacillus humidisoli]